MDLQSRKDMLKNQIQNFTEFELEKAEEYFINKSNSSEIPQEHQEIILDRIKKSDPEKMISWKEARKQLKFPK